jgi:hypothetical protein
MRKIEHIGMVKNENPKISIVVHPRIVLANFGRKSQSTGSHVYNFGTSSVISHLWFDCRVI